MSADRPIRIDLGMPARSGMEARAGAGRLPTSDQRDAAQLEEDARRLRTLTATPSGSASAPLATATPFSLFGAAARVTADAIDSEHLKELDAQLSVMARRLLVGEGSGGSPAVEIQLDDPELSGVTLRVFEAEGGVAAEFICRHEDARERLARAARWLAQSLSERLQRDTLVRVLSNDPEDSCLMEARGSPAALSDSGHKQ